MKSTFLRKLARNLPLCLGITMQLAMPITRGIEALTLADERPAIAGLTDMEQINTALLNLEHAQNWVRIGRFVGMWGLSIVCFTVVFTTVWELDRWIFWCGITSGLFWLIFDHNVWGLAAIALFLLMRNRFRNVVQCTAGQPDNSHHT